MDWLRKQFLIFGFKWRMRSFIRVARKEGVPNHIIVNCILSMGKGAAEIERSLEELAAYFEEST